MDKKIVLAGCVILNPQGEVLLIHRNTPGRIQWETPGGKIEQNEKAESAAIREIKEEIGVDVKIIREIGRQVFFEERYAMEYIWFLAKITRGEPLLLEKKHDALNYFSWSRLHEMSDLLSPNVKNLLTAFMAGNISVDL